MQSFRIIWCSPQWNMSQDEVGLLAENFNRVAEAVSEKIGELQGMVRKRDQLVISFPKADGWSGCRESSLI